MNVTISPSPPVTRGMAVSQNFVKLNMKVKRHSRRPGHTLTGSAYKRKEWKRRQKEGEFSEHGSGGGGGKRQQFVCFKCGETGHWARNCKERGSFTNLGSFSGEKVTFADSALDFEDEMDTAALEELDKECPFPSIREAAEMVTKTEGSGDLDSAGSAYVPPPPPNRTPSPPPPSMEPLFKTENGKIIGKWIMRYHLPQ